MQPNIKNYTFITDCNSPLAKLANKLEIKCFYIPANVGGRFSALSSAGLLPLGLCGVDIKSLLAGAGKVKKSFFDDGFLKEILIDKALFYAKHHTAYHINCVFAYSETLEYFCEWYVQLWGESLGKKQKNSAFHVGLTPVGLIGPKDQHSFLQLLMDGTRDKSATFIKIDDFTDNLVIPDISFPHLESLDILNGIPFHDLINMQCDSTIEALIEQNDIPIDELTICKIDEFSIGSLMFYYELLTSSVGQLINVNTYDQLGVEYSKTILKNKLLKLKDQS
jgi:glucose-6-phosphate isomerase